MTRIKHLVVGKRAYPTNGSFPVRAGEYGIHPLNDQWYARTPNGYLGCLSEHEVIEHEDGTITVNPSILVADEKRTLWHGYLEKGIWREC